MKNKNAREMKLDRNDLFEIGNLAYLHHEAAYYGEELVCVLFCPTQTKDIARMLASKALKCYGRKYKVVFTQDLGWGATLIVTNLRYDDLNGCDERPKRTGADTLPAGEDLLDEISNELDI